MYSGRSDGGTVEHLMMEQWNTRTSDVRIVEHLIMEKWNIGWLNSGKYIMEQCNRDNGGTV